MTLDAIKTRTDEVGDCWIWNQAVSSTGYPIIKMNGGCQLVRRVVLQLDGRKLKPRQPVITTCGEKLCVHPKHIKASTAAKVAQEAAKRGAFSRRQRGAKIAAAKRRAAKLTLEQVCEIRASEDPGPVLAARFGVNRSVISRIKSGAAWRDYSGLFEQLISVSNRKPEVILPQKP